VCSRNKTCRSLLQNLLTYTILQKIARKLVHSRPSFFSCGDKMRKKVMEQNQANAGPRERMRPDDRSLARDRSPDGKRFPNRKPPVPHLRRLLPLSCSASVSSSPHLLSERYWRPLMRRFSAAEANLDRMQPLQWPRGTRCAACSLFATPTVASPSSPCAIPPAWSRSVILLSSGPVLTSCFAFL
jgi:hypothetical protein